MKVKTMVKDQYDILIAYGSEVDIIESALKVYIDYCPRKERDKPTYEAKRTAVYMVEAIHNREIDREGME